MGKNDATERYFHPVVEVILGVLLITVITTLTERVRVYLLDSQKKRIEKEKKQ